MLIFLLIGGHQFFEFLTLVTKNEIAYKTGLIISISSVYFLLQSLEIISNKRLFKDFALVVVLLVSFHIAESPMGFEEASFYLKHNSAFFWAAGWMLLFIFWHICAFNVYSQIKDAHSRKTMIIYLLTVADISFILSAIYVLVGHFAFSVNVCTDSPSVWCTFYVIQSFLIPILFFRLPDSFSRSCQTKSIPTMQFIIYLVICLIILILLCFTLPLFKCLSWKFVFP